MRFQPKSENEVAAANLLPAGVYDFEVLEGSDEISKAGNDMIKLKLRVFSSDGDERVIFDYLLESVAYKLRHSAEVCGLMKNYEAGELHGGDFEGKIGKAKIGIQKSRDPNFPDKNNVQDYVFSGENRRNGSEMGAPRRPIPPPIDDDIPF